MIVCMRTLLLCLGTMLVIGTASSAQAAEPAYAKEARAWMQQLRANTRRKMQLRSDYERLLEKLDEVAKRLQRQKLAAKPQGGDLSAKWRPAWSSRALPLLRLLKRVPRYPQAAILDLWEKKVYRRFELAHFQRALALHGRLGLACGAPWVAEQVARAYVTLKAQPYGPSGLQVKTKKLAGGGHRVHLRYQRSVPAPRPGRGMMVTVGTKREQHEVKVRIDAKCRLKVGKAS